jgi:methylmalonyl-CoA mutase
MKLFDEFSPQSIDEWKSKVEHELKGLSFADKLIQNDEIEGLAYSKYANKPIEDSAGLNYTRAARSRNNDWQIGKRIEVKDEKIANKLALEALEQGATSLTFVFLKKAILWSALFNNIELDFIESQFETLDADQVERLTLAFPEFSKKPLIFLNDPIGSNTEIYAPQPHQTGQVFFKVNAYGIHQSGGNATEEIAFALSMGHEYIDEASAMIRFYFGIGAKYFVETTKFRVFRKLWANVIEAYSPKENCSHACYIYAQTGFVNKSLKDPYTNLLRQTTEAMSAVLGGVNELIVRPYDEYAQSKESDLSNRMALNISNILKEESYMDKVVDPLGGSFSIEDLTTEMEENAWQLFQRIEKIGSFTTSNKNETLIKYVAETAKKRIEAFHSSERILIGVNKYPNLGEKKNHWLELPEYLGLEALILEKHLA